MFRNNFFPKSTVGESETPSLLQKEKRRSAKSDVSKVLFPELAKITNLTSQLTFPLTRNILLKTTLCSFRNDTSLCHKIK